MDFIENVLKSLGIYARKVSVDFVIQDIIFRLYKKTARKESGFSALITAKDGSTVGYIRLSPDNAFKTVLCRECLVTDFVSSARVIANAQKCRQGIA